MPPKTYLTKPSHHGRLFLQYYPDDRPSLVNFSTIIKSGYLGSSTLQTLEKYNRMYLFASNSLARSAINRENQDGSLRCYTIWPRHVTCQQCCRTTSTYYTCGCNNLNGCGPCLG